MEMTLRLDARRYEAGTQNLLGLVGLNAALELLLEIGIDRIAAELLRKRSLLASVLQAKGFTVLHADAPSANASGITTFYREGIDPGTVCERLDGAGIVASLRADRAGRKFIRFSPHFYNTDTELQRALELL